MSVQIIKKTYQARGQFNGGAILENKPIGFPREGGELKPYSNLFYWAHAWSDEGSTIPLHPHQGFEIMSFVLKGDIEHYDTAHQEWKKLDVGAAQIIRAGNGISHSERMNAGSHMFQIWFDPDLGKTLQQPATYDDYEDAVFPREEKDGLSIKKYIGEDAPIQMDTPGIAINQWTFTAGEHSIELDENKIHSVYLIEGTLTIDDEPLETDDFFILQEEGSLILKVVKESKLFVISSLAELNYLTYRERMTL